MLTLQRKVTNVTTDTSYHVTTICHMSIPLDHFGTDIVFKLIFHINGSNYHMNYPVLFVNIAHLFNVFFTFSFCYNVLVRLICIYLIISLQWLECTERANKNKPVSKCKGKIIQPLPTLDTKGLSAVLPQCNFHCFILYHLSHYLGEINLFD